jgi:hypothetical protein
MITFQEFLTESRTAPLYHGLPIRWIGSILKSGITGYTEHTVPTTISGIKTPQRIYGVSLSRSMRSVDWFMKNERRTNEYIILELDQRKISQRFKIIPIDYHMMNNMVNGKSNEISPVKKSEAEEFVVLPKGMGESIPTSFITTIHYPTKSRDNLQKLMDAYPDHNWVPLKT